MVSAFCPKFWICIWGVVKCGKSTILMVKCRETAFFYSWQLQNFSGKLWNFTCFFFCGHPQGGLNFLLFIIISDNKYIDNIWLLNSFYFSDTCILVKNQSLVTLYISAKIGHNSPIFMAYQFEVIRWCWRRWGTFQSEIWAIFQSSISYISAEVGHR